MHVASKLISQILKSLKIWKIVKVINKKYFLKKRGKFSNFKKRNICERALSGVYVYKISSRYLEKCPSFDVLKVENGHFQAISVDFCIFPIFKICPIWTVHKVF